jgi:hypothetical protein
MSVNPVQVLSQTNTMEERNEGGGIGTNGRIRTNGKEEEEQLGLPLKRNQNQPGMPFINFKITNQSIDY